MTSTSWLRWILGLLLLASWLHAWPAQAAPRSKHPHSEQQSHAKKKKKKKAKPASTESADSPDPSSEPLTEQAESVVPEQAVLPAPWAPVAPAPAQPSHEEQTTAPDEADQTQRDLFSLSLAGGILNRSYSYRGASGSNGIAKPFEHQLPAGPALFLDVAVYPLAKHSSKILANLGLIGSFSSLLGNEAVFLEGTPDETRSRTTIRDYNVGLRGRFVRPSYQLGLRALYGRQSFDGEDVTVRGQTGALIPDIRYSYVQLALDAKLQLSAWSIGALLGTRLVMDTGSLEQDWCPVHKVHNLDLSVQLGVFLTRYLELIATVGVSRYAITFGKSLPDSALLADGAVDRYLSGSLGLRFIIPVRKHVD